MQRTINGKSLSQVERELAEPFDEKDRKNRFDTGYAYYKKEAYLERLNSVVGSLRYSVEFPKVDVAQVNAEWEISAQCIITIYDDNGDIVCKKSMVGGKSIVFPKLTDSSGKDLTDSTGQKLYSGRPAEYANQLNAAATDAFKRTCLLGFGIGAELAELNGQNGQKPQREARNIVSSKLVILSPFVDRKNSKQAVIARQATCVDEAGVQVTLIIWNKKIEELKKKEGYEGKNLYQSFEDCVADRVLKNGKVVLSLNGYYTEYNGERQFILNDLSLSK